MVFTAPTWHRLYALMSKDESKKEGTVPFFQRHFAWHLHHRPTNRAGQKHPIEDL